MSNYLDPYSSVTDQANRFYETANSFYETIQPILTAINVTQNLESSNSFTNNFYARYSDVFISLFNQTIPMSFPKPFKDYIATINETISVTASIQEYLFGTRQAISESEQLRTILCSVDFFMLFSEADIQNNDAAKDIDDYITTDSPIIREIKIPDEFVLPIGNSRIRISAGHFWAIIACIIAFLAWRFPQNSSTETQPQNPIPVSEVSDSQNLQNNVSLLCKQNQILLDIFESVDATMSSQADSIEAMKNHLQALDEAFQFYQRSHLQDQGSFDDPQSSSGTDQNSLDCTQPSSGTDQSTTDNMNESPNTASEN